MLRKTGVEGVLCFTDIVLVTGGVGDNVNNVGGGEGSGAQGREGGVGVYVSNEFSVFEMVAVFGLWGGMVTGELGGGEE